MAKLTSLNLLGALTIIGTTAFGAGCMVHARGSATASAEADPPVTYASRPTLVAVGSGVWVVRASARATYYVGDNYWVYRDGVWYRSRTYAGGWAVVEANAVPSVIVNNDHALYVSYQGSAGATTKPAPGDDYVAANDDGPGKKNKDELPGVGNKRKAAGEQPGQVGKGLVKDQPKDQPKEASPPAKAEKQEEKAEKKEEKAEKKEEKNDDKGGKKK